MQTTRLGGFSSAPYDSLNLGDHVGDAPLAVARNRMLLNTLLPSEPVWLKQVHGTVVANADLASCLPQADACIARHRDAVCVVMTADCLPVLLCDTQGSVVGAAHAGWKGLADGVIEAAVQAMDVAPQNLMAWLGPAISQPAFEVGEEVRATVCGCRPAGSSGIHSRAERQMVGRHLCLGQLAPERVGHHARYMAAAIAHTANANVFFPTAATE